MNAGLTWSDQATKNGVLRRKRTSAGKAVLVALPYAAALCNKVAAKADVKSGVTEKDVLLRVLLDTENLDAFGISCVQDIIAYK